MRRRLPIAAALAVTAVVVVLATLSGAWRPTSTQPVSTPVTGAASPTVGSTPDATATVAPPASPDPTPHPTAVPVLERAGMEERLQAALDEARTTLDAPGMVASIVDVDGHAWTGIAGVADLATGRPLTAATPFAIASVSKTFLAAEILQLVEAGQVDLSASVVRLLPTTLVAGRAIDPRITVRMLLDHTSGLGDFLVNRSLDRLVQGDPTARWSSRRALSFAGKPLGVPGAGYHYSNTNYVLLGLIAEAVTGHTLAAEYRARFFGPLGLASATYQGAEPPSAEMPTAYRYPSVRLGTAPVDVTDGSDIRPFTAITTAAGAAGSVAASATDLARWATALYGGDVLSPALRDEMVADAISTNALDPAYPYGLGVQVLVIDGRVTYGHSGRLVGARSVVRWFPSEGFAIAIVTNQSRFDLTPALIDLLEVVAPLPPDDERGYR